MTGEVRLQLPKIVRGELAPIDGIDWLLFARNMCLAHVAPAIGHHSINHPRAKLQMLLRVLLDER